MSSSKEKGNHDDHGDDIRIRCLYTAASANRNCHIADWAIVNGIDELVYASHRNLIFARKVGSRHPPASQLIVTPKALLNVVKFAYSAKNGANPRIIAASSDGFLHLYSKISASTCGWKLIKSWSASISEAQLKTAPYPGKRSKGEGLTSIQALGVLRPSMPWTAKEIEDITVIVSASSDGSMKIWSVDASDHVELKQSAILGRSRAETKTEVLPLDIAIATLPPKGGNVSFLMAIAGTDGKVDFWLAEKDLEFKRLFAITGHSDWVRSLDFCRVQESQNPTLMLATGSQDHTIRLWRVEKSAKQRTQFTSKGEIDEFERLAMQIEDNTEEETIAAKAQSFTHDEARWDVSLDALLSGHEHWITSIRWAPTDRYRQPAALLSSSADNSVILWTPSSGVTAAVTSMNLPHFTPLSRTEQDQDIWVSVQRFGELGSVGSAANGMYGVLWDPRTSLGTNRQAALAHGYGGALQIWSRELKDDHIEQWKSQSGLGGHFAPSTCVRWEPDGQYFITGGLDKTTRLYGRFEEQETDSWHELARPQTHGFEIVSLAWLSQLAFSSAGDEKIIRVLEAPRGFVQTMQTLSLSKKNKDQGENLLAFRLPTLGHLTEPSHLERAIQEATLRSLPNGSHLTIAVVSPVFDQVKDGESSSLSFEQAEAFLKWCYSLAWSVAIEADELLFEVDVLLIGDDGAEKVLKERHFNEKMIIDEPSCSVTAFDPTGVIKLAPSCTACPPVKDSTNTFKMPQYRVIAMGGTFDHLHIGHKILLSMAALCATHKVIVGVTDDTMLTKKKSAYLLEDVNERIKRVSTFLETIRSPFYDLQREVVKLQDVAGPAGTEADIDALLFTDETISGADYIDKEREKNGLNKLKRLSIGVIGAQGETDLKGKDASELAAAKVGSTAIRQWLDERNKKQSKPLDQVATLSGDERPLGASVPPLGLSNRSIYSLSKPTDDPSASGHPIGKAQQSIASHLTRPPVEDELHNNTLWCEVTKLYGHSLELLSLDVDISSGYIASSCKAKSGQLAIVLIHDRNKSWDQVQQLDGHSLDITKVRFCKHGKSLASVSRDRSWRLYKKQQDGQFTLLSSMEEAHGRIIYDLAWTFDSKKFATASRDSSVKIWSIKEEDSKVHLFTTLQFKEPITAVAFTKDDRLAIGSERGNLYIYDYEVQSREFKMRYTLQSIHSEAISELAWRPSEKKKGENILASSSLDGSVRLWQIP